MRLLFKSVAWCVLTCVAGLGNAANAEVITVADTGWYNAVGSHGPGNPTYTTGQVFSTEYRSFFLFDLSQFAPSDVISAATLSIYNPAAGYQADASELLNIRDVTGNLTTLLNGTGGVAAFNDLGTGTLFGSVTMTAADNGRYVDVQLNSDGLAALNSLISANVSDLFAFGGSLGTISGATNQWVFSTGFDSSNPVRLTVTTAAVPEPGSWLLMALGGLSLLRLNRAVGRVT